MNSHLEGSAPRSGAPVPPGRGSSLATEGNNKSFSSGRSSALIVRLLSVTETRTRPSGSLSPATNLAIPTFGTASNTVRSSWTVINPTKFIFRSSGLIVGADCGAGVLGSAGSCDDCRVLPQRRLARRDPRSSPAVAAATSPDSASTGAERTGTTASGTRTGVAYAAAMVMQQAKAPRSRRRQPERIQFIMPLVAVTESGRAVARMPRPSTDVPTVRPCSQV